MRSVLRPAAIALFAAGVASAALPARAKEAPACADSVGTFVATGLAVWP